jgi:hypothetical protein
VNVGLGNYVGVDSSRAFKTELANLATTLGLIITVCHMPPGTSKWNN